MKNFTSRSLFILASFIVIHSIQSCSKSSPIVQQAQQSALEKQFEDNILNKNFRVYLASDNSVVITSQYSGYTFRLLKATNYNGAMTAEKDGITYTGGWSCNGDYSKLSISLPSAPPEFIFLTRDWKFTKKALPVMELAPWGTTEPKILQMERF